jgi:hypothetical protein
MEIEAVGVRLTSGRSIAVATAAVLRRRGQ